MSSRSDSALIGDLLEAARRIQEYCAGLSFEIFLEVTETQDAVLRNIEVMGEAAKLLSPQMRKQHPEIAWKRIAGMRDKVIHSYFGINWEIVWRVVTEQLPVLEKRLQRIKAENQDCAGPVNNGGTS